MLRARNAWALCCCLAFADGLLGCNTGCNKENADAEVRGGLLSPTCTSFQSSSIEQPYLHFPAGKRFQFHHGLRQTPLVVQSYLAFVPNPLPGDRNGNTAETAGNQVIIEHWNEEYVQVRNDTCEDEFYLRLVLLVDDPAPECLNPTQGASGAGGAGGAAGAGG